MVSYGLIYNSEQLMNEMGMLTQFDAESIDQNAIINSEYIQYSLMNIVAGKQVHVLVYNWGDGIYS